MNWWLQSSDGRLKPKVSSCLHTGLTNPIETFPFFKFCGGRLRKGDEDKGSAAERKIVPEDRPWCSVPAGQRSAGRCSSRSCGSRRARKAQPQAAGASWRSWKAGRRSDPAHPAAPELCQRAPGAPGLPQDRRGGSPAPARLSGAGQGRAGPGRAGCASQGRAESTGSDRRRESAGWPWERSTKKLWRPSVPYKGEWLQLFCNRKEDAVAPFWCSKECNVNFAYFHQCNSRMLLR